MNVAKNKGADQLRDHLTDDLRLCFRICICIYAEGRCCHVAAHTLIYQCNILPLKMENDIFAKKKMFCGYS